jgi:septum site-determining protein MinC
MKFPLSASDENNLNGQAPSLFVNKKTSSSSHNKKYFFVQQEESNRHEEYEVLADDNTILVQRTIRSGQSIRFEGNVVVMGDVNPGGEIVAGGNIVVMGHLRGVVHAGAFGSEKAIVAAFRLQPTQLRIANHITRAPDGEEISPEQPEIARIHNDIVIIEKYHSSGNRGQGNWFSD